MFALVYAAIAVWTSGEALIAGASRLFGAPQNHVAFLLGYGVIALEVILIALYGHATIVWAQKIIIPLAVVVLALGVLAYAPNFHPMGSAQHGYALQEFWPTWLFAVTVSVGGPLSYAPSVGDYTRRISRSRYSDRQIAVAVSAGIFLGLFSTATFGAFTASTFSAPTASYVADMVATAPGWYVVPLLILAVLGGCGQGVISIYSSGLDLESIVPRLNRTQTTLIASGIAVVLMYLGVVVTDAIDSVTGMTVVLNSFAGSWVAINICGFFKANRGQYDPKALQRFGQDGRGGLYWFSHGFNVRAVVPFIAGSGLGLLTVQNDLYQAPFANIAGGIDVSLLLSVVVGGGLYWLAQVSWPAPRVVVSSGSSA
ncbi:Possible purine/cytosine permease [Mycobacteroides abscessus]|nr:Possible purine/cytosine permease [Mycobacteroides abscessus]CPV11188.1 Possible purine/cytosine permease [Mycobacteroides abscessus]